MSSAFVAYGGTKVNNEITNGESEQCSAVQWSGVKAKQTGCMVRLSFPYVLNPGAPIKLSER
jgi:hypothetical protein